MPAFTAISVNDVWSAHDGIVEELRYSYSERYNLLSGSHRKWNGSAWANGDGSASDEIAIGTDVQAALFFSTMQQFCISNCTNFMDEGITIVGTTGQYPTYFEYADDSAFYSEAGLGTGFRRKTVIGSWATPGVMQVGDIIGYWIFEDLVKAFRALLRARRGETWSELTRRDGYGYSEVSHAAAYAAAPWTVSEDSTGANLAGDSYSTHDEGGGDVPESWDSDVYAADGKPTMSGSGIEGPCSGTAYMYVLPSAMDVYAKHGQTWLGNAGEWCLGDSKAYSAIQGSTSTPDTDTIGDRTTPKPTIDSDPDDEDVEGWEVILSDWTTHMLVIAPSFTYT